MSLSNIIKTLENTIDMNKLHIKSFRDSGQTACAELVEIHNRTLEMVKVDVNEVRTVLQNEIERIEAGVRK